VPGGTRTILLVGALALCGCSDPFVGDYLGSASESFSMQISRPGPTKDTAEVTALSGGRSHSGYRATIVKVGGEGKNYEAQYRLKLGPCDLAMKKWAGQPDLKIDVKQHCPVVHEGRTLTLRMDGQIAEPRDGQLVLNLTGYATEPGMGGGYSLRYDGKRTK
jgi:hypothetical protein